MTWTKLDDGVFDHPKMVKAGEDAADLYVRGLVYCNRYLTDGRIEAEVLTVLTRKRDAAKHAAALVRVGAWEPHPEGGWIVHNFHEHNPTAEEVAARRAAISSKRSEAGKRGNQARWGDRKIAIASQSDGKAMANVAVAKSQNDRPVPSRPGLYDDDDDKAATAAIGSQVGQSEATEAVALDPRRERNALEVLAQSSRGAVSVLASAADMVALNDIVTAAAISVDELEAFGRALAERDAMKRIWPSSKARSQGQTIPAGWLIGNGSRKGRTFLEGVQRWRELSAGERIDTAVRHVAHVAAPTSQPAKAPPAQPIASDVEAIRGLFNPKRGGILA